MLVEGPLNFNNRDRYLSNKSKMLLKEVIYSNEVSINNENSIHK